MSQELVYIERKNTDCSKWDLPMRVEPPKDLSPIGMWVADMDFALPEPIQNSLKQLNLGYFIPTDRFKNVIKDWIFQKHSWRIELDWLTLSSGVLPDLAAAIQSFVKPGEKAVMLSPMYYPATYVFEDNGIVILYSHLEFNKTTKKFEIDFEDLETKLADPQVKLFFNCNPHNPCGRVYSVEELTIISQLCLKHNVLIVSDEIHWDLIIPSENATKHTPIASLSQEVADITITITAPSKTFNIPCLGFSYSIVSNKKLRTALQYQQGRSKVQAQSYLGYKATEAAYTECRLWLNELLKQIKENYEVVKRELVGKYSEYVNTVELEGSYLLFVDLRECCKKLNFPHNFDFETKEYLVQKNNNKKKTGASSFVLYDPFRSQVQAVNKRSVSALRDYVFEKTGIIFNDGGVFGVNGDGWLRMNLATRKENVQEACRRIGKMIDDHVAEKKSKGEKSV